MDEVKKELSKTLVILISYINAVLELVPTWLGMLKSTRVLTVIGTLALMYITWKYGGLTQDQLSVVSGIEGIPSRASSESRLWASRPYARVLYRRVLYCRMLPP